MGSARVQVAVVGAGISGLALGFHLKQRGVDVRVFEARALPGGNIRSEPRDGYLCEWGPNGWLDNEPATGRLIEALGIADQVVAASDAATVRWIVRNGKLRKLPMRPAAFLGSDVLSLRGKLRVLSEWAQPVRRDGSDESVFDFASRRIGREAAEVLVDAMVTGVYAGDSRRLSLRSTFARMHEMETKHGGLFKAMRTMRRERRARGEKSKAGGPAGPAGSLHSFVGGMQTIVDALAAQLGERLRLTTSVQVIAPHGGGWRLTLGTTATAGAMPEAAHVAASGAEHDAAREGGATGGSSAAAETLDCEQLVVACPSWAAAKLLDTFDTNLAADVDSIPSAPVAVVCLGFRDTDVEHVERGFGFLAPGRERLPVLGTLFDTWVFPNRSAADHVLTRTMIGGARDPEAVHEGDAQLVARALSTLRDLVDVRADAAMSYVVRHPRGIPQYAVGHGETLQRIDERRSQHRGLYLCGNSYHGVAMNACIKEAEALAHEIAGNAG